MPLPTSRCGLCDEIYEVTKGSSWEFCDDCVDAIAELKEEEELPCRS